MGYNWCNWWIILDDCFRNSTTVDILTFSGYGDIILRHSQTKRWWRWNRDNAQKRDYKISTTRQRSDPLLGETWFNLSSKNQSGISSMMIEISVNVQKGHLQTFQGNCSSRIPIDAECKSFVAVLSLSIWHPFGSFCCPNCQARWKIQSRRLGGLTTA